MKRPSKALFLALSSSLALSLHAQEAEKKADTSPTEEVKRPDADKENAKPKEHAQRGEHRNEGPQHRGPEMKPTTFLGVVTRPPSPDVRAMTGTPEGFGLVVEEVMPDSPAKAAGLQRYDLITQFNDQRLVNVDQLSALVRSTAKDSEVTLTLKRAGAEQKATVKLTEKMMAVAQHQQSYHFSQHFGGMPNKEDVQRFGRQMKEQFERYSDKMRDRINDMRGNDREQPQNSRGRNPQAPANHQRHPEGKRPEGGPQDQPRQPNNNPPPQGRGPERSA
jgi:hypothetical protein